MAKTIRKVQIAVNVPPVVLEQIDLLAEVKCLNRNEAVRWLLDRALEECAITRNRPNTRIVTTPEGEDEAVIDHSHKPTKYNRESSSRTLGSLMRAEAGRALVQIAPPGGAATFPEEHCQSFDRGVFPYSAKDWHLPNPKWPDLPFTAVTFRAGDSRTVHTQELTSWDQYKRPDWLHPDEDPLARRE